MNWQAGWALIRRTWLSWMKGRSFFFLLAFGWMIPPLIYLFVWATAAGGSTIGGFNQGTFIAYYLVLINVNQLTYAQTNWTVGDGIRAGTLSRLLLYPVPPILDTLAAEIAGKVVYMTFIIPFTAVLALLLKPVFAVALSNLLLFTCALLFAFALRFFWGLWLASLAFWLTRADALLSVQDAIIFLLGGQIAPTVLLPPFLHSLALVLPFRYMVAFPVELLVGNLNTVEIAFGFGVQIIWLIFTVIIYRVVWRTGLRRYSAVGG